MKVRARAAALIAAACCLSIVLPAQQPASAPYTVVSREARRPLAVRVVGGQEMFALDDLARLFSLTIREDTVAGALTVTAGAQTIVLSPQQPLASVAGRMISLPAAPVRDGRAWYVPVDFVSRALAPGATPRIELRKPSRLILAGDIRMPRVAARVEPLGTLTRVTVDIAPATPHSVAQDGTRLIGALRSGCARYRRSARRPRRPTRCRRFISATPRRPSRWISGRGSRRSARPINPRRPGADASSST